MKYRKKEVGGYLYRLTDRVDDYVDRVKFRFRRKLRLFEPVNIVPYHGFGNSDSVYLKGRVLENKGITESTEHDTALRNFMNMYKRFNSDEVPFAKLTAKFYEHSKTVFTDKEGYFDITLKIDGVPQGKVWHELQLELLESPLDMNHKVQAIGSVIVPPENAEYGIISDIDDTIVETNATSIIKIARNTLLRNSRSRMPFPGVSAFYKALVKGGTGLNANPLFYVSSSPWNIYDFLIDFLKIQDIPTGPLMLSDYGFDKDKLFSKGHKRHKSEQIERILNMYPKLSFILIGDSGQEDAAIYADIIKQYPGRILSVYIRDLNIPERTLIVKKKAEEIRGHKVDMVLVENTLAAAEHASEKGFIPKSSLKDIAADKRKDS